MSKNASGRVRLLIQAIKEIRVKRGLTLDSLANSTQLHRTAIGLIERHERVPTIDSLFQIADALDISLSSIVAKAEKGGATPKSSPKIESNERRKIFLTSERLHNETVLQQTTALSGKNLLRAVESTYATLDFIDAQLLSAGSPRLSQLVELANLSSMIGNILGASIAKASNGIYQRNRPHSYPDLIPTGTQGVPLELKVALETNRPKGHLPKEGAHLTFRYILGDDDGHFEQGKDKRGCTVWIWEVRAGVLTAADYDLSNTAGDSGKTAVIKSSVFNQAMKLVYLAEEMLPYRRGSSKLYPGFN